MFLRLRHFQLKTTMGISELRMKIKGTVKYMYLINNYMSLYLINFTSLLF